MERLDFPDRRKSKEVQSHHVASNGSCSNGADMLSPLSPRIPTDPVLPSSLPPWPAASTRTVEAEVPRSAGSSSSSSTAPRTMTMTFTDLPRVRPKVDASLDAGCKLPPMERQISGMNTAMERQTSSMSNKQDQTFMEAHNPEAPPLRIAQPPPMPPPQPRVVSKTRPSRGNVTGARLESGSSGSMQRATSEGGSGGGSGSYCSTSLPSEVNEVFSAKLEPGWLLLYVFQGANGAHKMWFQGKASPQLLEPVPLPRWTRGILILLEPSAYQGAKQAVRNFRRSDGHGLPICAMLIVNRLQSTTESLEYTRKVQRSLDDIGVDDICIKPENGIGLEIDFAASAERARSRLTKEMKYEMQIDMQKACIWDLQRDLWAYVAASFPEFPTVAFEDPDQVESGDTLGDRTILQRIGVGRTSKVYSVQNTLSGEVEAVKVIQKKEIFSMREVKDIFQEVRLLSEMSHRNIVALHEFVHTEHHLLLHMDLAGTRNLYRFMSDHGGFLSGGASRHIALQLARALAHCHGQGVAHCDVKPENMMLSADGEIAKLVDFGFAVESTELCDHLRGTMPFVAPEVLLIDENGYQPCPVDIWASGILLLEMLCGLRKLNRTMGWNDDEPPDERLRAELVDFFNRRGVLQMALEDDGVMPERSLVAILQGSLAPNPTARWTAAQFESSEWLTNESSALA